MGPMKEEKANVAKLLRSAADGIIPESAFWPEMERLFVTLNDPLVALAREEAFHFWGNFHERNLLLIPVRPDPLQLEQSRRVLRLLANAIENDWSEEQVQKELDNS
jgi:hypothetical protein